MMNELSTELGQLSEKELQSLISKSKKQIKKLKVKKTSELNSKDVDVMLVADAVRALSKQKKVSPSVALTAVAKSMRISITASRKPRIEAEIKYQHPDDENKTWKGFGKRPLWLVEELNKGQELAIFRV
ncbi:MAG: H-NS histone family protein [Gammaproteobacteria bacterium]|nr:H-NS histone family protein [Gammaproteobacteria bacterium]